MNKKAIGKQESRLIDKVASFIQNKIEN